MRCMHFCVNALERNALTVDSADEVVLRGPPVEVQVVIVVPLVVEVQVLLVFTLHLREEGLVAGRVAVKSVCRDQKGEFTNFEFSVTYRLLHMAW